MTCKDAIYRELIYSGMLTGFVDDDHVKQDMRLEPDALQEESEYPWLIFRRVSMDKDDASGVVKEVIEFELIGKNSSATNGDDLLEQIKDVLIATFGGKRKTWGKYEANGDADPDGGKLMSASHLDTTESFDDMLDEKIQLLTFRFAYSE